MILIGKEREKALKNKLFLIDTNVLSRIQSQKKTDFVINQAKQFYKKYILGKRHYISEVTYLELLAGRQGRFYEQTKDYLTNSFIFAFY